MERKKEQLFHCVQQNSGRGDGGGMKMHLN